MADQEEILVLLNAAEGLLQVGLAGGGRIMAWQECEAAGQGAERLIPTLADMLEEAGCGRERIGRIACVRGPGGFTGIRLALTTAFGLSRAICGPGGERPRLAGIDYLPLLAASVLLEIQKIQELTDDLTALWVLTHARRGQVNMQGFAPDGSPLTAPETVTLSEAVRQIEARAAGRPGPLVILGSGVVRNREELSKALPRALLLPEIYNHPSPAAMLRLADSAAFGHEPIEPLYLRPCDAEENLPGIAAGLGLDPEEAALALRRLQTRLDYDS